MRLFASIVITGVMWSRTRPVGSWLSRIGWVHVTPWSVLLTYIDVRAVCVEVAVIGPGDVEATVVGINRCAEDGEEAELVRRTNWRCWAVGRL